MKLSTWRRITYATENESSRLLQNDNFQSMKGIKRNWYTDELRLQDYMGKNKRQKIVYNDEENWSFSFMKIKKTVKKTKDVGFELPIT